MKHGLEPLRKRITPPTLRRSAAWLQVFAPETAQAKVFQETKYLVQSACDGYNVCIFAYGQTGSGKTFTIYGSDSESGLTPRGARSSRFAVQMRAACCVLRCALRRTYGHSLLHLGQGAARLQNTL